MCSSWIKDEHKMKDLLTRRIPKPYNENIKNTIPKDKVPSTSNEHQNWGYFSLSIFVTD
jgi:hypothetical protein